MIIHPIYSDRLVHAADFKLLNLNVRFFKTRHFQTKPEAAYQH